MRWPPTTRTLRYSMQRRMTGAKWSWWRLSPHLNCWPMAVAPRSLRLPLWGWAQCCPNSAASPQSQPRPLMAVTYSPTASSKPTSTPTASCASVRDLALGRDAIAPDGAGNLLQLHRDQPNLWPAWNLERHYRNVRTDLTAERGAPATVTLLDEGPLLATVRVERPFGDSQLVQDIRLGGRFAAPGRRHRHRLARAGRGAEVRVAAGRARRAHRRRDPVRPRQPSDA